jgi:serine/threonine-protein kinase RsbW
MTDVESTRNGQLHSARAVEFRIAARLENLAVLRSLITAVGTYEDLDLDAVADLRLAVDEACTRLIRSAAPDSTLVLVVDPRRNEVVVEASTTCATPDVLSPGSFSWHVLTSLTDDVQTFRDGHPVGEPGGVVGISMTTRRVSDVR